jgi:hypothetical protein
MDCYLDCRQSFSRDQGRALYFTAAAISYKSESQDPGLEKDWLGFRTVSRYSAA